MKIIFLIYYKIISLAYELDTYYISTKHVMEKQKNSSSLVVSLKI